MGLTSSVFIEHPLDLAAEPQYQTMTWWAPGAPLVMGFLMKAGCGQQQALKLFLLASTFAGWAGWFFIAVKFLAPYLRVNVGVALVFCISPLLFTPSRDPDEMAMWALLPWLGACVALVTSRGWLSASILAGIFCAAGIVFCHVAALHFAAAVFAVCFLPVSWRRKMCALLAIVIPTGAAWFSLRWLLGGVPYLDHEPQGFSQRLGLIFDAVGATGLAPFLGLVDRLLPSRVVVQLDDFAEQHALFGWLSLAMWLALGLAFLYLWRSRLARLTSTLSVAFFFFSVVVGLPLLLVISSASTRNLYIFSREEGYYYALLPVWVFVLFLVMAASDIGGRLRLAMNCVFLLFAAYVSLFYLTGFAAPVSKAKSNIIGYSYAGDELAAGRKNFAQAIFGDMELDALEGEPAGIVYSQHPQHYSLIHGMEKFDFRGGPLRSFWRQAHTSKAVTIYFILPEDVPPMPLGHLLSTVADRSEHLPIPELKNLPGWRPLEGVVMEVGVPLRIYRADLPAGWRASELFSSQPPAATGEQ